MSERIDPVMTSWATETCAACGGSGLQPAALGGLRPCGVCRFAAFTAWYREQVAAERRERPAPRPVTPIEEGALSPAARSVWRRPEGEGAA